MALMPKYNSGDEMEYLTSIHVSNSQILSDTTSKIELILLSKRALKAVSVVVNRASNNTANALN